MWVLQGKVRLAVWRQINLGYVHLDVDCLKIGKITELVHTTFCFTSVCLSVCVWSVEEAKRRADIWSLFNVANVAYRLASRSNRAPMSAADYRQEAEKTFARYNNTVCLLCALLASTDLSAQR